METIYQTKLKSGAREGCITNHIGGSVPKDAQKIGTASAPAPVAIEKDKQIVDDAGNVIGRVVDTPQSGSTPTGPVSFDETGEASGELGDADVNQDAVNGLTENGYALGDELSDGSEPDTGEEAKAAPRRRARK
jgi:hypothetical protein